VKTHEKDTWKHLDPDGLGIHESEVDALRADFRRAGMPILYIDVDENMAIGISEAPEEVAETLEVNQLVQYICDEPPLVQPPPLPELVRAHQCIQQAMEELEGIQ